MDLNYSNVYEYVTTTPVYGDFKVWHVIVFLALGPMLTWPMLIVLLFVFSGQTINLFKGIRSSTDNNG